LRQAKEGVPHIFCVYGSKLVNEPVFLAKNRVFIGEFNKIGGVNGKRWKRRIGGLLDDRTLRANRSTSSANENETLDQLLSYERLTCEGKLAYSNSTPQQPARLVLLSRSTQGHCSEVVSLHNARTAFG
jgi:hypothetical protein